MSPMRLLIVVMMFGCAGAPSAPPHTAEHSESAKKTDAWRSRASDETCRSALSTLAAGQLDGFRGLARCGRVDAEAALGSSGDQPSKFEQFGEYRVYPRPQGTVLVWFLSDDIRVMQLIYPKLPRPIPSLLGEPEAKTKSGLSEDWDQWVYASRGLTAHVRRNSHEVVTLFAYKPTSVAEFLQSDIAKVSKNEAPIEDLK
jgi:hypothetical protein